jgi:hypothetical protein
LGLASDFDEIPLYQQRKQQNISPSIQRIQIVSLLPSSNGEGRGNNDDDDEGSSSGGRRKRTWDETEREDLGHREHEQEVDDHNISSDPWMKAAVQMDTNLDEMVEWISKKGIEYASVEMSPNEASLIESTISSFTATTATEIESLRQVLIQEHGGGGGHQKQMMVVQHRNAIVQILMDKLRGEVAGPFQRLQKLRRRPAVHMWHHPLECGFYRNRRATDGAGLHPPGNDDGGGAGGSSSRGDAIRRFLPLHPAHRLQSRVWESYHPLPPSSKRRTKRPVSRLFAIPLQEGAIQPDATETKNVRGDYDLDDDTKGKEDYASGGQRVGKKPPPTPPASSELRRRKAGATKSTAAALPSVKPSVRIGKEPLDTHHPLQAEINGDENDNENERSVLEHESMQLQLRASNDLDAVQRVERQMVDITSLLSQFAALVQDQSAEVVNIHSATESAKDNLDQGQEHLIEAKERTEASRHYLAILIVALSFLLLLFHWVRP